MKKEERIKKAEEYIKTNIWKKFWKYKLNELWIIPLSILAIWKVPYWIGLGIVKLFNIPITNSWFCEYANKIPGDYTCGIDYSIGKLWSCGAVILFLLGLIIWINWIYAKQKVEEEAENKFKVNRYDLE